MIYKDGYPMDENLRVTRCPLCENEEFSKKAEYCRICGTGLYNRCEGEWDRFANDEVYHYNPGNARYCETCGKPTYFLTKGLLEPWDKAKEKMLCEEIEEAEFDENDIPF
ncbi:MAG: hypothetical protein QHH10_14380 [Peptococcaceae bacterium]|jgi:ribosomal protein L37E|nr:hypothetical protein [Eubacteriales bacterium]MDH7526480.1 hypothetical protein [Peptococcaceae bacterium]